MKEDLRENMTYEADEEETSNEARMTSSAAAGEISGRKKAPFRFLIPVLGALLVVIAGVGIFHGYKHLWGPNAGAETAAETEQAALAYLSAAEDETEKASSADDRKSEASTENTGEKTKEEAEEETETTPAGAATAAEESLSDAAATGTEADGATEAAAIAVTETAAPTTEAPHVTEVSAVVSGGHYVGDTLGAGDFTVTVTMSDGSTLTNPAGWGASPLSLGGTSNEITVTYGGMSGTVLVNAEERPAETTAPETAPQTVTHTNRRIFVGDSRVVCMRNDCPSDSLDTWICLGGAEYPWFTGTAVPTLKSYLDSEQIDSVIIMMGINDCAEACVSGDLSRWNLSGYSSIISSLVASYPNTHFYFGTIYHTDGDYDGWRDVPPEELNPVIDSFNSSMAGCGATCLDVCGYCTAAGITTADGVHIKGYGNVQIHDWICANLVTY